VPPPRAPPDRAWPGGGGDVTFQFADGFGEQAAVTVVAALGLQIAFPESKRGSAFKPGSVDLFLDRCCAGPGLGPLYHPLRSSSSLPSSGA
jgi:hypothetical protein